MAHSSHRPAVVEAPTPTDTTLPVGLTNRFEVGPDIGSGSFANVFKVKRKSDGVEFAVKRVPLVLSPLKEVALLSRIQHHNVIRLESVFHTHTHEYMVLELCTGE
jgi:serine/threonine protein kinase